MRKSVVAWVWYYLPLALWIGVIFRFSTSSYSSVNTESTILSFLRSLLPGGAAGLSQAQVDFLNFCARKLAHLTEYAILAVLVSRACVHGRRERIRLALALAVLAPLLVASIDEWHQGLVPDRTPAVGDVLIDTCGAALAAAVLWYHGRRRTSCPTLASLNS